MKKQKPDFGRNLQSPAPLQQTDALLYGLQLPPAAGTAQSTQMKTPITTAPTSVPLPSTEDDEMMEVSFTTLIRKTTFLRLKQAEFWKPGFMIKKATDKALSDYLDNLPEANRTLPEEEKHRLNLKKLRR
ncbi:hypothetical protein F1C16_22470 (plasmid) [Hymenobacter sp. NBH84]|uniref:hypothetical protein n=1 Tax=Hymenobacter sp. NBH84 TaxID=2596915 RepID=UPI001628B80A|nr:hypothetical protein [Hymenobacter sp. NBH84]QNE42386.1 hypothetical protein F1C16_22470 [Hymenobacter sp. NBH84]